MELDDLSQSGIRRIADYSPYLDQLAGLVQQMGLRQRSNLSHVESSLRSHWSLGQNSILSWSPLDDSILILVVPHYAPFVQQTISKQLPLVQPNGADNVLKQQFQVIPHHQQLLPESFNHIVVTIPRSDEPYTVPYSTPHTLPQGGLCTVPQNIVKQELNQPVPNMIPAEGIPIAPPILPYGQKINGGVIKKPSGGLPSAASMLTSGLVTTGGLVTSGGTSGGYVTSGGLVSEASLTREDLTAVAPPTTVLNGALLSATANGVPCISSALQVKT